MTPIEIAILGCGFAARTHARTLSALDGQVRCAFASRDPARAREYAARHGGRAFESYEEALCDPGPGVALIATPPATHLALALSALVAGKDVIVEKPAFLCAADFDTIREAQLVSGRRVFVAENYYYKPLAAALREIVGAGLVGEVRFVLVNALKEQAARGFRDDPTLAGGGALFEGGIHWVNLMANLGLTPRRVRGHRAGPPGGADRSMQLTIEYAEGAVGTLLYSWEIRAPLRGLRVSRIFGSAGSVTFESNGLCVLVRGTRRRLLVLPGAPDVAGYRAMFRDFLAALRSGADPQMTLDIAERDVAIVEAAYRSARGSDLSGALVASQLVKPAWQKPR